MAQVSDKMIEEVMRHLDKETVGGASRMSVEFCDTQQEYAKVSHKCCKVYGRDATEVVAILDMCQDLYLSDMKKQEE